jgi:hypothetical protein
MMLTPSDTWAIEMLRTLADDIQHERVHIVTLDKSESHEMSGSRPIFHSGRLEWTVSIHE